MNTSRFIAGALVGVAVALLLAPETREDLKSGLSDTAGKWKRKLNRLAGKTGVELQDLRDILEDNITGMSDELRKRLRAILEESASSAKNIKRNLASELK